MQINQLELYGLVAINRMTDYMPRSMNAIMFNLVINEVTYRLLVERKKRRVATLEQVWAYLKIKKAGIL